MRNREIETSRERARERKREKEKEREYDAIVMFFHAPTVAVAFVTPPDLPVALAFAIERATFPILAIEVKPDFCRQHSLFTNH